MNPRPPACQADDVVASVSTPDAHTRLIYRPTVLTASNGMAKNIGILNARTEMHLKLQKLQRRFPFANRFAMAGPPIKSYVLVLFIGHGKCLTHRATRILLVLVLLLSICGFMENSFAPAGAQVTFNFSVSLNLYSILIAPSHAADVQVTVPLVSGSPQSVTLTSSISPENGQLSASFAQPSGTPTFTTTLTVTAYAAPPGEQYAITVGGVSQGLTRQAPVLTVTISCPQGPCPIPRVDSTDKTAYAQGQFIQFNASAFVPGDGTASCLTNDITPAICESQANADSQGNVSGSMQVTSAVVSGTEYFYLKDTTNGQQTLPVSLTILPLAASATLTTTVVGTGAVTPSCASGCSQPVGEMVNITATPASNWSFSGWNVTGAACSNGATVNPCTFTMPNNSVSVTANFAQHESQTLFTAYTGSGTVTPSCPSGCPVAVGSLVSILATPAAGWTISGYHVTAGVSCGSQGGYTCSFTMPNFPVTFVLTFTTTSMTITATTVVSTTSATSVISTAVIVSPTTSTTTVTTISVTQTGSTQTTIAYSTSTAAETQTQLSSITEVSTLTATVALVATALQNPTLEFSLGAIILLSLMVLVIGIVRRSPRRGSVSCPNCGFRNSGRSKFCVGCGQSLRRMKKDG